MVPIPGSRGSAVKTTMVELGYAILDMSGQPPLPGHPGKIYPTLRGARAAARYMSELTGDSYLPHLLFVGPPVLPEDGRRTPAKRARRS